MFAIIGQQAGSTRESPEKILVSLKSTTCRTRSEQIERFTAYSLFPLHSVFAGARILLYLAPLAISLRSAVSMIYCVLPRNNHNHIFRSPVRLTVARHREPDLELQARRACAEVHQYPLSPIRYQKSHSSPGDRDRRSGIPIGTPSTTVLTLPSPPHPPSP